MNEFIFDELLTDKNMIGLHKITDKNIKQYIYKLAKYNYYVNHFSDDANYNAIVDYIKSHWNMFSGPDWHETIENSIKNCKKREYRMIESIKITKQELDYIKSFNDIRLEKLLFIMLCVAKYDHYYSDSCDYWLNRSVSFIFKQARVHVRVKERLELLRKLYLSGAFALSHKTGSSNKKLLYVSDNQNDEIAMELTEVDFKELAYTYCYYTNGFSGYAHCSKCGCLIKKKSNRQKYCVECSIKTEQENSKDRVKKYREKM